MFSHRSRNPWINGCHDNNSRKGAARGDAPLPHGAGGRLAAPAQGARCPEECRAARGSGAPVRQAGFRAALREVGTGADSREPAGIRARSLHQSARPQAIATGSHAAGLLSGCITLPAFTARGERWWRARFALSEYSRPRARSVRSFATASRAADLLVPAGNSNTSAASKGFAKRTGRCFGKTARCTTGALATEATRSVATAGARATLAWPTARRIAAAEALTSSAMPARREPNDLRS